MKKLLLIAVLVFLTTVTKAQMWCPPGAEWHWGYNWFAATGYVELSYISDTTYAGVACHKILTHTKYVDQQFWVTTETYSENFTYEDNGVAYVYGYNWNTGTSYWDTLYNFNANPNDKWHLFQGDSNDYVLVQDTGHHIIQGFNLKWLTVTYHSNLNGPQITDTIYERIGCTGTNYSFTSSVLSTDPEIHGFCNYSDNGFNDWNHDDIYCTDLPTGMSAPSEVMEISLFPNPALSEINIKGNREGIFEYKIFNVFGQLIKAGLTHSDLTRISIDQLPPGLYNIELTIDDKAQRLSFIVQQ